MDDLEPDRLGPVARPGTRERRGRRVATYVGTTAAVAALAAAIMASTTMGGKPSSPGPAAAPSASPIVETPPTETPGAETAPVVLDLPGWSCGEAGDEKMLCSSDAGTVVVTWRPARDHADWLSDPDKSAPYVGDVHGPWFVTVDGTPGISAALAVSVGEALRWVS